MGVYHAGGAAQGGVFTFAVTQRNLCNSVMTPTHLSHVYGEIGPINLLAGP